MCCCCGLRASHIASIIMGIIGLIFVISALSGTGSDVPWGRAEIIYKFDNADDCTSNYAFGTGEFEADACITAAGDKDKNTIEYDSSECNFDNDLCDRCDSLGMGVEACMSLSLIFGIAAIGLTIWRIMDTNRREDVGCTLKKTLASTAFSLSATMAIIGMIVWGSCQREISVFVRDAVDDNVFNADEVQGISAFSSAYVLCIFGWIFLLVPAGNQCCAVPKPDEIRHDDVDLQPGAIVTATPVQPGMAVAVAHPAHQGVMVQQVVPTAGPVEV